MRGERLSAVDLGAHGVIGDRAYALRSAMLSAVLGRPVVLERAQSDQPSQAEIDPTTVFGDVPVEQVLPGRTVATMPNTIALPPGLLVLA